MSLYKPRESYNDRVTLNELNPCQVGQDDVHSMTGNDDDWGHGKGKEKDNKDGCPDPGAESNESIAKCLERCHLRGREVYWGS